MERLLLLDNAGMVGGLAANRDSPTWANDAIARGFYDATWPGVLSEFGGDVSLRRLGDILNHGKMYLLTQIGVAQTAGSVSLEAALGNLSLWHAFGDPTLEMWTGNPHRFIEILAYAHTIGDDSLTVHYARSGAVITALQEQKTDNGTVTVPVGRATVENGTAVIPFFSRPLANLPIALSASYENAVSVPLRSVQDGPDLVIEKLQLDTTELAPGSDLAGLLKLKVSNPGNRVASGTVDPDGSVKVPAEGYMIDLVLSADSSVPEGFAQTGGPDDFVEDALLVGGRVSRTPDVEAMGSVMLPAGPPLSSDLGGMIPSKTPAGTYYLCARIDPGNAVQEAEENNNVTCRKISVGHFPPDPVSRNRPN